MKIACVVGARPNFMKIAPILEEIEKYPELEPLLVHTGQHYDYEMSQIQKVTENRRYSYVSGFD